MGDLNRPHQHAHAAEPQSLALQGTAGTEAHARQDRAGGPTTSRSSCPRTSISCTSTRCSRWTNCSTCRRNGATACCGCSPCGRKTSSLQSKLEDQLCLRRDPLTQLFADAVISEVAVTGADPFVLEGTDVTMIFRLKQPEVFRKAAAGWLDEVRKKHPDMADARVQLPRPQGRRRTTRTTAWSVRSWSSTRTTSSTRTRTARSAA